MMTSKSCSDRHENLKTLAYLNYTKEWKLMYRAAAGGFLETYTDSSYSPEGERSHGGAVVLWAGAPVAWRTGRQSLITTSSVETELLAASEGCILTFSSDALLTDMGAQVEGRGGQFGGHNIGLRRRRQLAHAPFEGTCFCLTTNNAGGVDCDILLPWRPSVGGRADQNPPDAYAAVGIGPNGACSRTT